MVTTIVLAYLLVVLAIGSFSHRLFRGTGEDYFVASRTIGPFVLLMTLFGTNMTAFAILGASGEAYHVGIGVFGLVGSAAALINPVIFLFVGTRLWRLGRRHGYLTQVGLFRDRWESSSLGLLLFVALVGLMIPYLLIGVMGAGLSLEAITDGAIPRWAGSLVVCAVVLAYVWSGGLRGTAWVNTFQTLVFMTLGIVTFAVIVDRLGGLTTAMASVAATTPDLLIRGDAITPWQFLTYACIPLSAGMMPHMFMHWLSARSAKTFRLPVVAFPICLAVVWLPSVLLGVLGRIEFPDLEGTAANAVLIEMVGHYAPGVLGGLLAAGVCAAIMSSLDSQSLSLGTMFTEDIVRHYAAGQRWSERHQVRLGRAFVGIVLAVTFVLAQLLDQSIFALAIWSFSGLAALFPLVAAALFWRRSTRQGAVACVVCAASSWVYFLLRSGGDPGYTLGQAGVMPVAVMVAISTAAMVGVSLITPPPGPRAIEKFFGSVGCRSV
jgi:SSS family solute:Na+ symporter